jgi:quercetin dioxygenase-like cupin family protein
MATSGARPSPEQPLTRETVLHARLPQTTWTDRVEVRRIRMLPGHAAGLHVHNGPVVGSIVEGSVVYQVEGGAAVGAPGG